MKKFKSLIIDFIVISLILITAIVIVSFGKFQWKQLVYVGILIYVINTIFIFFIVLNNDAYEEKISWTFFLIVFPIIAHVFFALFRMRRDTGISREKYEQEFSKYFKSQFTKNENLKLSNFEKRYEKITNQKFHYSNLEIYQHGFDAYKILLKDLRNANEFIHIEMYIIKPSEIFEEIKNILIEKSQLGVDVKIIVDDFGSWKVPTSEFEYLISQGIEIKKYNKTIYPFVRHTDNKRLHRKFFVIDGKCVHFGGLNIADEYGSYNKQYGYWMDLNFKANGLIVNDYESTFLYDWYKLTNNILDKNKYHKNDLSDKPNSTILLFNEGPDNYDHLLERSINNWINNIEHSIKIATPYFVPTQQIFSSLKHALKLGIDVEIYIPGKPDKKFVYLATKHHLNKLVKLGAKVKVMNNIFLHSKVVVFDNKFAYIGTNNLDMRSLYSNHEAINIVTGEKIINQINDIFDSYNDFSSDLSFKENKIRNFINEFLFRILAPLM